MSSIEFNNKTIANFNTPAFGILQKSTEKSRFANIHLGSDVDKFMFPIDGTSSKLIIGGFSRSDYKFVEVTVLQVLRYDNKILVEYILNSDII